MDAAHRQRRSVAIGRRVLVLAAFAVLAAVAYPAPARAEDRVAALNRMLGSSSDKTRLSAVLALAKLGEPQVEKPLIRALHDPSPRVRGVAAVALGRLECGAALPVLRTIARDDTDPDVRKAATTAAMKITSAHPTDRPRGEGEVEARRSAPGAVRPTHTAYAAEPHAELYVLVNSSADDSPGATDPATRRVHAGIVKRALLEQLAADATVTSTPADAERWGLVARHLDLSVTRLSATKVGGIVEIAADLRIAISDDSGRMLSFLSGGAKVQIPADKYDPRHLQMLRTQALDTAMRGMSGKVITQLRTDP
jgi:hypothetical protein